MKFSSKRRKVCAVFLFALLILSGYWLLIGKVQLCMVRMMTGFPCPGCGLTHAAVAALKGNWQESFRYHPLLLPTGLLLLLILFRKFRPVGALFRNVWFFLFFFGVYIGLYVVRMVLYYPRGPYPMVYDRASLPGVLIQILSRWFG